MGSCYRIYFWLLAIGTIFGASAARAEVAVQYHCAGGAQLAADAHLTTLHKVLALRWTTNFHGFALARFSGLLTNSFQLGNNPSSILLIEPLLNDLVENESLGTLGGASTNTLSFILALHLEAPRTQLWQENLNKVFGGGGEMFTNQEFRGWRWRVTGSNSSWMIPARDWLLVGCGDDFSAVQLDYLNQIKAQGRPVPALKSNWLEADLSSIQLGGWFRILKPAIIKIAVAPNEDNLRISARVIEAEAIPWNPRPWQIPKDLMRGQIISFVAGQNVAAFLNVEPTFAQLAGDPLTNQFYFWALDQMPFLNYMVWPVADASNALESLATAAPAALNPALKRFNGSELAWFPAARKLILQNIRLIAPVLEAVQDDDGQFLFSSSYPRTTDGNPASDALLTRIQGRTNLVYFDWELTGRRLGEWQVLRRMIFRPSIDAEDTTFVESQWLGALAGLVGNTTTEITRVAPNELSIERTAPLGFTGVELVLLANWLSDVHLDPVHAPAPAGKAVPLPVRR